MHHALGTSVEEKIILGWDLTCDQYLIDLVAADCSYYIGTSVDASVDVMSIYLSMAVKMHLVLLIKAPV